MLVRSTAAEDGELRGPGPGLHHSGDLGRGRDHEAAGATPKRTAVALAIPLPVGVADVSADLDARLLTLLTEAEVVAVSP